MSTFTDNSKFSSPRSFNRLNQTTGNASEYVCKERIKFPVKDSRLSKTTGNVFVEKGDVLEDMLDEEALDKTRTIRAGLTGNRSDCTLSDQSFASSSSADLPQQKMKELRAQEAYQLEQSIAKTIQRKTQNAAYQKEKTYSNLVSNIEKSMSFLDSVDKNILLMEETKRNKTRRQFEDWNTQIHGNIQMDISKQVSSLDSKKLNKKKNEDYSIFLDITNRKSAIFRDIIIESEYDPLEPNRRSIKAKTMRLNDPTKIDQQKAEEESSMLEGKRPKQKLGKETLNVELWATGKIESTPFGVAAKMMGSVPAPGSNKARTMRSNVKLDHFDYPKGRDALDLEMPRGKRTQPISDIGFTANRVFNA